MRSANRNRFQRYIFTPNRRTAVLAALVAVGIGVVFLNIQRQSPDDWRLATSGGAGLTVMSFNVLFGGQPAGQALDAIAKVSPDILCIQELTPSLARAFEARFAKTYPHRLFEPRPASGGIGIASRYPLEDGAILGLGFKPVPAAAATARLGRSPLRLACVHLIPPQMVMKKDVDLWERFRDNKEIRLGQVARLLKHLGAYGMPAIIMGDMNEWPGQAAVGELAKAGFRDSCNAPGERCGPTWPGQTLPWPATFRIDYILGRGVRFADSAVLEARGSDHYPVAARVIIGPRQLAEGNAR